MKTIFKKGWIPGALAFLVALTVAFAFTRPVEVPKSSPEQSPRIWIKYNCAENLVPYTSVPNTLPGTSEPNSGLFARCPGDQNLCARLYDFNQTVAVGGNPNIRIPAGGAIIRDERFCTENVEP